MSDMQAHGAEILCSKYNASDVSAQNSDVPLSTDSRWLRFLEALSDKGYFKVCPLHCSSLSHVFTGIYLTIFALLLLPVTLLQLTLLWNV